MLLAQLSDLHILEPGRHDVIDTAAYLAAAVGHVNAMDPAPDLVLFTGDLANNGTPEQYDHLEALLAPLVPARHLMPGNHDVTAELQERFSGIVHDRNGRADGVIEGDLRIVCLDSTRPSEPGGTLDPYQVEWLDSTLADRANDPTIVALHHPPFATGIEHMDHMALGVRSAAALADVVSHHPQVERVLCGHLHRTVFRRWAGTVAMTGPSVAHAVALDLLGLPAAWTREPPALALHRWDAVDGLVTHIQNIGDYPPTPF